MIAIATNVFVRILVDDPQELAQNQAARNRHAGTARGAGNLNQTRRAEREIFVATFAEETVRQAFANMQAVIAAIEGLSSGSKVFRYNERLQKSPRLLKSGFRIPENFWSGTYYIRRNNHE